MLGAIRFIILCLNSSVSKNVTIKIYKKLYIYLFFLAGVKLGILH
jgi:hypothetical protein